jgi:cysteine synthase
MDAASACDAVQRPDRGRVFDSIVDTIGGTPIVRLRKSPAVFPAALRIGPRPEAVGKTILAIVPSFSERYLSTDVRRNLEGIAPCRISRAAREP